MQALEPWGEDEKIKGRKNRAEWGGVERNDIPRFSQTGINRLSQSDCKGNPGGRGHGAIREPPLWSKPTAQSWGEQERKDSAVAEAFSGGAEGKD